MKATGSMTVDHLRGLSSVIRFPPHCRPLSTEPLLAGGMYTLGRVGMYNSSDHIIHPLISNGISHSTPFCRAIHPICHGPYGLSRRRRWAAQRLSSGDSLARPAGSAVVHPLEVKG